MTTIVAYEKAVWGRTNIYVEDKDQAKAIGILTGKLTIDNADIEALRALGFEVILKKLHN